VAPVVRVARVVPEDPVVPVALESPVARVALVVPEDPVVPAVRLVLESPVVPVALVRGLVAALERELVQVEEAELEHGPVAALALDPAVVALKIKLATAAHPRGLVPLLEAGEDLVAAVAETTREPAAAEAVIAWEVAE